MPFHQTIILLPCHSLEDFPTHYRGRDADSILANWTSGWHPALISATGKQPQFRNAENPGILDSGSLVLIPTISTSLVPADLLSDTPRLHLVTDQTSRSELIQSLWEIEGLGIEDAVPNPESDLAEDFFGLGYAFLQIQLMTRQLRGSTNLDEVRFEENLVAAANGFSKGDELIVKTELTKCFDMLFEEKNSYYAVQPDLIDLVLTAPTTLGSSLKKELESTGHAKSVLITGSLSRQLEQDFPANFELLKTLVNSQQVCLVGGLDNEFAEPLLSVETSINQIELAARSFCEQFDCGTEVYARRRFGMGSLTPLLLDQFNFLGAMHCTMDAGGFPMASSSNIRWEADDGSSILALAQTPADANEGATYLSLGVTIGRALDSAHLATVVLAHWPSKTHFCFQDLCRVGRYGTLFGQFKTLNDYFEAIYDPGYGDTFSAQEYRGEYLSASLARAESNPVSRIVDYWNRLYRHRSLCVVLVQRAIGDLDNVATLKSHLAELNQLQTRIELATEHADNDLDRDLDRIQQKLLLKTKIQSPVVLNTTSFPRVILLRTGNQQIFAKSSSDSVRLADSNQEMTERLVHVPPISITQLSCNEGTARMLSREPSVIDENHLRNEFFEVEINSTTGGIRSIDKYDRRKNLLSQQLALRIPSLKDSDQLHLTSARYSQMECEEIQSHCPTRLTGIITTRGKLVDEVDGTKSVVGNFEQVVQVTRGIQVAEVSVTIEPRIELTQNVNHYFCSRIAWKHESADLVRSVQESSAHVVEDRFEAANFVEIKDGSDSITLLTGGIPFHRRASRRMLDSLLLVAGETRKKFRFGIGLNLAYPLQSSEFDFMTPPLICDSDRQSGWFFHLNCKNLVTTAWQPVLDDERGCTGVTIRIRETESRAGQLRLRCPRQLSSARRVNFQGEHLQEVEVEENVATINFHADEFFQIQLNWNP